MYNNIGKKVKTVAVITALLEAIGSVITAIILICSDVSIGWLLLFLGPVIAWISSWIIYAIGEAADKTEVEECMREISDLNKKIDNLTKAYNQKSCGATPYSKTEKNTVKTQKGDTSIKSETNKVVNFSAPYTVSGDYLICSLCGTEQRRDRTRCYKCGALFTKCKGESQNNTDGKNKSDIYIPTDDDFIDVYCPICNAALSYMKAEVKEEELQCPICDGKFKFSNDILR